MILYQAGTNVPYIYNTLPHSDTAVSQVKTSSHTTNQTMGQVRYHYAILHPKQIISSVYSFYISLCPPLNTVLVLSISVVFFAPVPVLPFPFTATAVAFAIATTTFTYCARRRAAAHFATRISASQHTSITYEIPSCHFSSSSRRVTNPQILRFSICPLHVLNYTPI